MNDPKLKTPQQVVILVCFCACESTGLWFFVRGAQAGSHSLHHECCERSEVCLFWHLRILPCSHHVSVGGARVSPLYVLPWVTQRVRETQDREPLVPPCVRPVSAGCQSAFGHRSGNGHLVRTARPRHLFLPGAMISVPPDSKSICVLPSFLGSMGLKRMAVAFSPAVCLVSPSACSASPSECPLLQGSRDQPAGQHKMSHSVLFLSKLSSFFVQLQ